jgi:hypothetical protein
MPGVGAAGRGILGRPFIKDCERGVGKSELPRTHRHCKGRTATDAFPVKGL